MFVFILFFNLLFTKDKHCLLYEIKSTALHHSNVCGVHSSSCLEND